MQLLDYKGLGRKLSINPMTVYRFLKNDPSFPKPVKLTANSNRWVEAEVDQWIKLKQGETNDHRRCGEEAFSE